MDEEQKGLDELRKKLQTERAQLNDEAEKAFADDGEMSGEEREIMVREIRRLRMLEERLVNRSGQCEILVNSFLFTI